VRVPFALLLRVNVAADNHTVSRSGSRANTVSGDAGPARSSPSSSACDCAHLRPMADAAHRTADAGL